jgi:serine/threonine-protein kinase
MAPEQVMSKPVDPRTDIWALGAILFELLTLRSPFVADSVPHLYAMIVSSPPVPLRTLMPKAPAKLETAILRCLEKSPANRPQHVGDLAILLAPFASKDGATSVARIRAALDKAPAVARSTPSAAPLPSSRRRGASIEFEPTMPAGAATGSRVGAVIGGALATAAVLVAITVVWRGSHASAKGPYVAASARSTISAPANVTPLATPPDPPPRDPESRPFLERERTPLGAPGEPVGQQQSRSGFARNQAAAMTRPMSRVWLCAGSSYSF